jgi:hypothetical protein
MDPRPHPRPGIIASAVLVIGSTDDLFRAYFTAMEAGDADLTLGDDTIFRGMLGAGLAVGMIVVWSIWSALVVANVPAVTARWPLNSPLGAVLAWWIPIISLWKPYVIVRNVLAIVAPGKPGPMLITRAWWLLTLLSVFAPTVVALLVATPTSEAELASTLSYVAEVRLVLFTLATVFAMGVVIAVEREQWTAVRRRATTAVSGVAPA